LSEGENSALLVRPWLTPSILILIAFVAAIAVLVAAYGPGFRKQHTGFLVRAIGALIVISLFITSIPYGMGLRVTAAIKETQGRAEVSQQRDLWLRNASEIIGAGRLKTSNSSIAIYSTSVGEETLVRWIPYLANKQAYFLRNEDLIRYIYVSTDSSEMLDRELDVKRFIEEGSLPSCLVLQGAGISQVWVTPNATFDGSRGSEAFEHDLVDVDCDSLE
jgi:hypothetical protein